MNDICSYHYRSICRTLSIVLLVLAGAVQLVNAQDIERAHDMYEKAEKIAMKRHLSRKDVESLEANLFGALSIVPNDTNDLLHSYQERRRVPGGAYSTRFKTVTLTKKFGGYYPNKLLMELRGKHPLRLVVIIQLDPSALDGKGVFLHFFNVGETQARGVAIRLPNGNIFNVGNIKGGGNSKVNLTLSDFAVIRYLAVKEQYSGNLCRVFLK